MSRPRVLVAALDPARNVSRVPAMLADGGCSVDVLCPRDTSLARSWFVRRRIAVPRDAEAIVAALRRTVAGGRFDLVTIADEALLLALAERLDPWMSAVLPFPADAATCALVLDKNRMLRAIAERGVPIPLSLTVSSRDDLVAAADRIGYPLALKDAVGCGGAGVRLVDTAAELLPAHASLAPRGDVTVQRFLRARSGCTDVVFDRGVPLCWTSAYMLEQWPTALYPSTVRLPVVQPRVEPMLRAVGDATAFHGLGGVDWLEDAGGNVFFLEFNARVTHVVGPARPEFGRTIGRMLRGTSPAPHEVVLPARPIPVFPAHFVRALKSQPRDLATWLPFRSSSSDLDWRDVGVISSELGAMAAGALRRVFARSAGPTAPPQPRGV